MKHISRSKKSFLWQAVLASTFFGGFPLAAHAALTAIAVDTTTAVTPDTGGGAGGLGGYNFTADNKTLSVTDGYIIGRTPDAAGGISVDNNSGGVAKLAPILTFLGSSEVQGQIGTTNPISIINLNGAGTVEFDGNVTANVTNIVANGTAKYADNVIVTGAIDNTSGVANKGTVNFVGSGQVTGNIGNTNSLLLVNLNTAPGINETIELNGAIINAATIQLNDNTVVGQDNTLKLNNAAMVLTTTNGILPLTNDRNTLDIFNAATINSDIGNKVGPIAFNLVKVAQNGNTTVNGDIYATTTQFNGANTLILTDTSDISGSVTTTVNGQGILQLQGTSNITGTIGSNGLALSAINILGLNKVLTIGNDAFVNNINIANDGAVIIQDNADVTGNINNTSGVDGKGTLTFQGTSNMNGTIGATNSLLLVNLSGGVAETVNFTQNINAQTVTFTDDGTATLASGITVSGPITSTGNPQGNLVFLGNFTVNNPIGTLANPLTSITANGPAGTTVSQFEDMFATDIDVNNGGTLSVLDSNLTLGGAVNLTGNSTLAIAAIAAPVSISDDLNIAGGSTLEISLNRDPTLTYINVANNLNINAGAFLELTNVPTFQPGHYEITIVDANGGVSTAPTTIGDSLLVNFSSRMDGFDLILDMDVNAASVFADRINTRGVAGALDAMAGKNFLGSLQDLLNQLPYFTSEEQLNDALAALAPIVDGSFTQETFAAQLLGYGAVSDRIRHLRQQRMIPGIKPPFPSGLSYGDDCDENGHGRWFKLYGQYADQGFRESVAGYNSETWGVAIGSDVSLNDLNLVGVSANLSHTYVGHDVSESTSSIYSLQGAIYGEQDFCDWWYFNWVASVAYNKYTTERNFVFGLLPLSPQSDFIGWQFGTKGELGYEYIYNGYHIIPNTTLYYSHLALNGYNESGAGTASQSVDAQYYNMLKAGMGVRAAYHCPYNMGDRRSIIFQPEVRMNVFYDFINDNMATTSNFTGGGPSFVTVGATPAATSVNLGASLSIYSDFTNYVVTLSYDFEGKPDYHANAGYLRLRYEW